MGDPLPIAVTDEFAIKEKRIGKNEQENKKKQILGNLLETEKAITEHDNVEERIIFYSDSDKVLASKNILMMFSPVIRYLVASLPCCTPPSISIPSFSPPRCSSLGTDLGVRLHYRCS